MSPENQRRAQRGLSLICRHQEDASFARVGSELDYLIVADMLADIRHLCAWKNVDFDRAVTYSGVHYVEETTESFDDTGT